MASAARPNHNVVSRLGEVTVHAVTALGDFTAFAMRAVFWTFWKRPAPHTLLPAFYAIGVRSVPVIALTGSFIGMVLAVQAYNQFSGIGLTTRLGSIINISIVRELGPVLAATMLAGRVGSAMAAELATMRVTEQIDALACLGANPVHYLVVPRLLSCVLLIPLLTILADFMGIMGGALLCTRVYNVDADAYWRFTQDFVNVGDFMSGLLKAMFFGGAIALVSCQRGFEGEAGAEGVGQAATEAFVSSFVVILILDFFLTLIWDQLPLRLLFGPTQRTLF
jgi:phospholipid/cholesterol/gamma-HCH transport system permease protein